MSDSDSTADPTKEPEFQRVLKNMMNTPPKPKAATKPTGRSRGRPKKVATESSGE